MLCGLSGCASSPELKAQKFLEQGRKHFARKDYSRAVLEFRNAAQARPRDPEPLYQMALAYLEMNQAQAAVGVLLKAAQLDPHHRATQQKLAELMSINYSEEVVRQAQQKAEALLQAFPGDPDVLHTLAVTELRLGQDAELVAKRLEEALGQAPQHLKAALMLAAVKIKQQDHTGAEQVLRRVLSQAPQSVEHALAVGTFLVALGKPEEAEKEFRRALTLDANSSAALVALGSLLLQTGRQQEAAECFRKSSQLGEKAFRLVYALFLWQTNQTDAALAELQRLSAQDRADRQVRTLLVSAYRRVGRDGEAQGILSEALSRNPKDADALMQRSEILLAQGKIAEAQQDLLRVLQFQPDSAPAHLLLSRVYGARAQKAGQRQELMEALRLDPHLLAARVELAQALRSNGAPQAALEILDQTPEPQRRQISILAERHQALLALGRDGEVRRSLDESLQQARHPVLLMQDGLLRFRQKDWSGARKAWREVLSDDWRQGRAVEAIALSYLAEGKRAEALAVVRDYAARQPESAQAQHQLGVWLQRAEDFNGARAALLAARRQDPKSESIALSLARLEMSQQRPQVARGILVELLHANPRSFTVLCELAQLEHSAGRLQESITYYERALAESPEQVAVMNNLAYLLADSGKDLDRALQLAQKAKQMDPENPAVNDTIGWVYYHKGMYATAVEYLQKADAKNRPLRRYHLGMAYLKIGERQRAIFELQSALQMDPTLREAQMALQRAAHLP